MTKFLNISTDTTLGGNSPSDEVVSSQKAIKNYVDNNGSGANTSLSNLTSTGANIGNWSSNVTNCITEISQDIKLDLSSGTLKLKSGSKVYIPNGVGVFDTVTTTADITTTNAGSGSSDLFYFYSNGSFMARPIDACFSRASQPTVTTTTAEWYDITNNVIKHTANTGSTWTTPGTSFPLCICSRSGGTITGIKQVFNGFGYIGSTIFALPGVKGLIPNGRKADGSLNNINFTLGSVKTATDSTSSDNVLLVNASALSRVTASNYFYDEEKNIIINKFNNAQALSVLYGTNTTRYGVVSNFATRTVFCATDYNDYIKIVDQVNINTTNIALKQDEVTALNYDNISNCITEIPQDIKLELYNGTITLKSGSKLYIPNGAGVFDTVTLSSNKTFTASGSGTTKAYIVYYPGDGTIKSFAESLVQSGTSYTVNDGLWYDTTNNIIKRVNGGTVAYSGLSFPICVLQITNGTITSIDQVFNGFGYIGSTIFALPNIKGLAPDGRNADGTLKSVAFTTSSVKTQTLTTNTFNNRNIILKENSFGFSASASYDEKTNTVSSGTEMIVGNGSASSGRITSLYTKQAFHAVDYSDTEYIANQAMPSDRYVDLTLGTSGATPYTAPADGYFTIAKTSGVANAYLSIDVVSNNERIINAFAETSTTTRTLALSIPVSKGNVVYVYYSATGTTNRFRFVYANGSK